MSTNKIERSDSIESSVIQTVFEDEPNPALYFESRASRAALDELRANVTEENTVIALIGDAGTGKTLLLDCLLRLLGDTRTVAYLSDHQSAPHCLTERVAKALKLPWKSNAKNNAKNCESLTTLWKRHAPGAGILNKRPLIIIDDARNLEENAKWEIGRLLLAEEFVAPFTVILAGRPDITPLLRHLTKDQGVKLRKIDLEPLDDGEIQPFIEFRLQAAGAAGAAGATPISIEDIQYIQSNCEGVPRRILETCRDRLNPAQRSTAMAQRSETLEPKSTGAKTVPTIEKHNVKDARKQQSQAHKPAESSNTNLEQVCDVAEQLEVGLGELVAQLADVGEASQETLCQYLDAIETGQRRCAELQRVADAAARLAEQINQNTKQSTSQIDQSASSATRRIESTADERQHDLKVEHSRITDELNREIRQRIEAGLDQLKTLHDRHSESLNDALRDQLADAKLTTDTGQSRVREAVDQALSQVQRTTDRCVGELEPFGPRGENTRRLSETVDAGVNRLRELVDRAQRDTEEEQARQAQRGATATDQQLQAITAAAEQQLQAINATADQHLQAIDATAATTQKQLQAIDHAVEKQLQTIDHAAEKHLQTVNVAAKKQLQAIDDASKNHLQAIDVAASTAAKRFDERLNAHLDAAMREFDAQFESRLTAAIDAKLTLLNDASDRLEARLLEVADEAANRATETVAEAVTELHLVQLNETTNQSIHKINTAAAEQVHHLEAAAQDHQARCNDIADAKLKQLASQLAASNESIRAVADSTRNAQVILSKLLQESDIAQSAIRDFNGAVVECESKTTELSDLKTTLEQSTQAAVETLDGASTTVQKIESLIQDAWTLATTAQNHSNALNSACRHAAARIDEINSLTDEIASKSAALADQNQRASQRKQQLDAASAAAQDIVSRLDGTTVTASEFLTKADATLENISARHNRLTDAIPRAESATRTIETAFSAADGLCDRLLTHRAKAEETLERLAAETPKRQALAKELEETANAAQNRVNQLATVCEQAEQLRDALITANHEGQETSHEVAQLLASLVERRDILDSGDQSLNELLDRAEAIRDRIQQLQTRSDAFEHQINGMLADPRKIIDEAKIQARQLDSVCKAVRKVFAGLSQVSLNANRDVSKFTEVSREANARLAQLTSDTDRAAQMLRDWVEEAVHTQSRLAKTIARVPAMDDDNARMTLSDLSRTATEALPSILKAGREDDLGRFRRTRTHRAGDQAPNLADIIKDAQDAQDAHRALEVKQARESAEASV